MIHTKTVISLLMIKVRIQKLHLAKWIGLFNPLLCLLFLVYSLSSVSQAYAQTISGSGDTNYVAKFTSISSVGDSLIYDNGSVGIGTTNPAYALDVNADIRAKSNIYVGNVSGGSYSKMAVPTNHAPEAEFFDGGSRKAVLGYDGNSGILRATFYNDTLGAGVQLFNTGGVALGTNLNTVSSNAFVVDQGNSKVYMPLNTVKVGINTSSPSQIFQVNSSISSPVVITSFGDVGIGTTTPTQSLDIVGGNGRVESGFNWLTNSDIKFKTNITTLTDVLQKVNQLRGVRYDLRTDSNIVDGQGKQIGFIAQELEKQYPELVFTESNGTKSVAYDKMTAVLLQAVNEQEQKIDKQQQEIDQLKSEVETLSNNR